MLQMIQFAISVVKSALEVFFSLNIVDTSINASREWFITFISHGMLYIAEMLCIWKFKCPLNLLADISIERMQKQKVRNCYSMFGSPTL